ncbi:MAG: hypothetical protein ACEQSK_17830 [Sphingomonadaceae bacterium]
MDPATDLPPTGGVSNATTLEYVLRRVDDLVREERAAVRELRLEIRHDHEVNEQRLELIGCAANLALQGGVKSADGCAVRFGASSAASAVARCTGG